MRIWPTPGLLLLATLLIQVSLAEDLYWEGDEDSLKEFIEVKDDANVETLRRQKRDWWNPFSSFLPSSTTTTTPPPENYESITEDTDDSVSENKDDEDHVEGSGSNIEKSDSEIGEKTLRVSFVVEQPYSKNYSNRDSAEFQKFSKTLAESVNRIFENLPGTQKASLVRIQSRPYNKFTCKVTFDIVTNGFDDTDKITEELRNHIRKLRRIGDIVAKEEDFSANVVDPGSAFETCQEDEHECNDGSCIPASARCNGTTECPYGSDEQGCPIDNEARNEDQSNQWPSLFPSDPVRPSCDNPTACASSSVTVCPAQICDGHEDCPLGDDENNCSNNNVVPPTERGDQPLYPPTPAYPDYQTTTPDWPQYNETCLPGEFRCDENRCILNNKVCDQEDDCQDGTDERDCESSK